MSHEQQPSIDTARVGQLNEAFTLLTAQEGWAVSSQHFRAHYRGSWFSLEAYGRQLFNELGLQSDYLETVPDWLTPYVHFDFVAFAVDDLKRDSFVIGGRTGLHVFDRYADQTASVVESTPGAA